MHRAPFATWVLLFIVMVGLTVSPTQSAANPFPTYDVIQPNVSFWINIYSQYPTTQAIVHDARDLSIIYDVIDLKPHDAYRARKINRQRMKKVRHKYENILKHLAARPNAKNSATYRRVAELFGPQASSDTFRVAARRVRCQIGQRDRFIAGLVRSGAFINQIRTIFKSNGLPAELAYLPHVESSFNYQAYSKFGAAGIWQFTRSTGKRFMKVGYALDERRDPIIATHAAAALLKENFQKLGSWPLAITAYNHGAAGMARAQQKYGTYPDIFGKYRSRTFKFASRNFYSEFMAAVQVASNYHDYFHGISLDRPLPVYGVTLDGYVSFNDLCEHYNVPKEIAKSLNPALRPPVFNGQKHVPMGYSFRLPADIEMASSDLSSVPPSLYRSRQKPSSFYTVQRGDTAGRIARAHGVKLHDLILANNLSRRATIFPRQTLRIPLPGEALVATKASTPTRTEPVLIAKAEPPNPVDETGSDLNPVDETDSAQDLAEATDSTHDLVDVDTMDSILDKEEELPTPVLASVIPTPSPQSNSAEANRPITQGSDEVPSLEIVSADVRFEKIKTHPSRPVGTLQVEVEETLGHFAEWAGIRTQSIRRLNGLAFGKKLHLHQKVKIPLTKVTAQEFEETRYEYHKRLQEDFFSVYRISELRSYRVERGDNLWTLCLDKFDIPMWLLKSCNPEVDFAALRLHQTLKVPTIEKNAADDDSEPEPETDFEETEPPEFQNSVL